MISEVDIANLALTKIGNETIVSFDDETETARRCSIVFNNCKEQVLRAHVWNFALKIQPLALLSSEEILNYDYVYMCPINCLYIVKVFDEAETLINYYEEMLSSTNSKIIASSTESAYIKYISKINDPNLFDNIFINALACKIASELAITLTGDRTLAKELLQEYEFELGKAKKVNKQEKHTMRQSISPYKEAR